MKNDEFINYFLLFINMKKREKRVRSFSQKNSFLFLFIVIALLIFLLVFFINEFFLKGFTGGQVQGSPCTDADGDGYGVRCLLGADCNDGNNAIHPGVTEVCGDGKDNDCDGLSYNTCYYVDGVNGNDANNGLSLSTAWRTIDKADSALLAGNAVLIRAGTYSQSISPLNNGNSGNPIIYAPYNKEKVTITQKADFAGKSYIAVKGLRFFSTGSRWVTINSLSHHIEFLDNYFNSSFDTNDPSISYTGFYTDGSYIIIRNNFFEKWWGGDMVSTGIPSHHILFENNDLSQNTAAHASLHFRGTDSIIRNNYIHNPWERAVEMVRVDYQKGERILMENNVIVDNDWDRIGFNPSIGSERGSGETVRYNVLRSILRNNIIIGNNLGKNYAYSGVVHFSVYPGSYDYEKIRMYHNTLYRNRLNGITFGRNAGLDPSIINTADNRHKNNIISETENYSIYVDNSGIDWRTYLFERNIISDTKKTGTVYINDLSNRIRTVASLENEFPNVFKNNIVNKPLFVRESILDEAEARPQNFRLSNLSDFFDAYTLTSASPGKGQGTHLASVTVSGTGTRITLDDALYFSDGFGMIDGDALIIGNDLIKVIKLVDDTRIDVNRSITVQSGDKVYLALSGSSPDIGVYGISQPLQPTSCTDADGDGYGIGCLLGADCNDGNNAIHPSATEICGNGIDENCDGADTPCSGSGVPQWSVFEIILTANAKNSNPYLNGPTVTATFTGPGGVTKTVKGFWDGNNANGNNIFKIRFAPTLEGTWTYTTSSSDSGLNGKSGSINVIAPQSGNQGFLRFDPTQPYDFVFDSGDHYFMFGQTYTGLINNARAGNNWKTAVDNSKAHSMNKVRMLVIPWEPTNYPQSLPFLNGNHDLLNLAHWQKFDEVIQYLDSKDMIAEIILFADPPAPAFGTQTQDERYARYAIARFAAYPNVIWTLSHEWEYTCDNSNTPEDSCVSYWEGMGNLVRNEDPWSKEGNKLRLLSTHQRTRIDFAWFNSNWPGHAVIQYGIRNGQYTYGDQWGNAGILYNVDLRNTKKLPVANDEYGYIGTFNNIGGSDDRKDHRNIIWGIYAGGGFGTFGDYRVFDGEEVVHSADWHDAVEYDDVKKMVDFFLVKNIPYWQMTSKNSVVTSGSRVYALGKDSSVYVVYAANGGSFTINIPAPTSGAYKVTQYNPRDGTETSLPDYSGGSKSYSFDSNDWVLLIQAPSACTDIDGDGYGIGCSLGADCNDGNSAIHPGALEICGDEVDNNCVNGVDEGCTSFSGCLSKDPALALYFSFNDSTATDLSGNGNNGVISGATPVSGRIGTGFSFDGGNDYINAGSATALDNMGAVTVTAWVYPRTCGGGNNGRIINKAAGSPIANGWVFDMGCDSIPSSLEFYVTYSGTDLYARSAANSITLNAWNFVAVTWNGASAGNAVRLYINGIDAPATTQNPTLSRETDSAQSLWVGNAPALTRTFNGTIDEVLVFNRVLNSTEISSIYNNKLCPSPATCTDADGDGYGIGCSLGADCNDGNSAIHPGALEVCDGRDNDCDSLIDEGCVGENRTVIDNLDAGFSTVGTWSTSAGINPYGADSLFSRTSGDSATWTATLNPGIYQVYTWWTYWDSRSQNAPYFIYNGNTQLGVVRVNQRDIALASKWNLFGNYTFDQAAKVVLNVESNDSYNADAVRFVKVGDLPPACTPSLEICDGKDNDCDSQVDEGVTKTFYIDADGDTYGAGSGIQACTAPAGYVANNLDCNDGNANLSLLKSCSYNGNSCGGYQLCVASCPVPPPEICGNGIDENCDGTDAFCTGIAPTLTVFLPEEGKRYKNQLVPLRYTAKDASNCWYVLNGVRKQAACAVSTSLDLSSGTYLLQVFANNSFGQKSEQRNFRVLLTRKYKIDGNSFIERGSFGLLEEYTDAQLGSVQSLSISLPSVGEIEWLEPVDLTKDANRVTSVINFEGNVNISYNRIEVKSNVMPSLNKRARITFYGLQFSNPRILKDGDVCYACIIESYAGKKLVFSVPGFSLYQAEETPQSPSGEGVDDVIGGDDFDGNEDLLNEDEGVPVSETLQDNYYLTIASVVIVFILVLIGVIVLFFMMKKRE